MTNEKESNVKAVIGSSVRFQGEISGTEDLLILGAVEGTVNLKQNTVTVGQSAKVKADVFGNVIHVEGEITGNLMAGEQVVVHKTGFVRGNVTSPRISLEDGARVKGSIDTESSTNENVSVQAGIERVREQPMANGEIKKVSEGGRRNLLGATEPNSRM